MFVAVLLVAGLVCLCVGLLLSSTVWLVVSLVASLLAALLIYRNREAFAVARSARPGVTRPGGTPQLSGRSGADPDVWVIDGRPRYHRQSCEIIGDQGAEAIPLSQASEDGFIPCSLCEPDRALAGGSD